MTNNVRIVVNDMGWTGDTPVHIRTIILGTRRTLMVMSDECYSCELYLCLWWCPFFKCNICHRFDHSLAKEWYGLTLPPSNQSRGDNYGLEVINRNYVMIYRRFSALCIAKTTCYVHVISVALTTENQRCQLCCLWWHWMLSTRQLRMPAMTTQLATFNSLRPSDAYMRQ